MCCKIYYIQCIVYHFNENQIFYNNMSLLFEIYDMIHKIEIY